MPDEVILAIKIGAAIFALFLFIILCACRVSAEASRKEEQEEAIRRIKGQEQKLDDSNWQDDLVYDETFVKKEDGTNEENNN